ncbi:hypothetical protein WJX82_002400 [Trebouxia sp. C0006]
MDAIPYVDSLIKEYLLFRGFTGTLRAFNNDLSSDRGCGFQADQLCELVFRRLVPLDQASELMEVLDFLNSRVYSRLPGSCEEVIRKLEVSIVRAYIVNAVQAGKLTVVQDFFSQYGELLLHRAESSDWLQWFALPYLKEPAQDPRFQVFFTKEWLTLVEASFRNFLAEAIQHLPPPALLRFDTDRLQRSALQKQVDSLQTENAGLRQQLAVCGSSPASTMHHQPEAASKSVQPATPIQQNGSSQHLSQHVVNNRRSTGGSERDSRPAQRQASSGATLKSTASAEQLASHEQGITCCSFSPSGQNLATASSDGVVRISAPASLQGNASRAAVLNCGAPVSVVAWDQRADKVMLVGTKGQLQQWDLRRLSSKKLGQPQWTVDLSSFCLPLPRAQRHTLAVAQSSKLIATSSIKTALPIVTLDAASRAPTVQSIVACRQSESAKFVSALHWNPTLPVLCCGLNNGQVWLQHLKVD